MTTLIRGRVWKFGDNISADDGIIQYSNVPDLATFDIPALKAMCFADLKPAFRSEVRAGDLVVAGRNFGHHSHPHACVAMKESGIAAAIVESRNPRSGATAQARPFSDRMIEVWQAGSLARALRRRLVEQHG